MKGGIDDEHIDDNGIDVIAYLYASIFILSLVWSCGVKDLSMEVAQRQGYAVGVCVDGDCGGEISPP
jgi:hypothetical protein